LSSAEVSPSAFAEVQGHVHDLSWIDAGGLLLIWSFMVVVTPNASILATESISGTAGVTLGLVPKWSGRTRDMGVAVGRSRADDNLPKRGVSQRSILSRTVVW
jgi:hypothetical protein